MRTVIKPRTDITEISKRVAGKLNLLPADVKREIGFYWIDVDMMFTHCCGYSLYVEKFGTFWIYTMGIHAIAKDIDTRIRKKLRTIRVLKQLGFPAKAEAISGQVSGLMTRLILLNYTVNEYKTEILAKFPHKYKVTHQDRYQAIIDGLVELFKVPFDEFPITINHPVQEMYVRRLRRKGVLHNPVISNIQTYRGNYKKNKDPQV